MPNAYKLPITPNAFQSDCKCTADHGTGFIAGIRPDGTHLEWSTFLGGSGDNAVGFVAAAPDDLLIVAGSEGGEDFPFTGLLPQPLTKLGVRGFRALLSGDGSALLSATVVGGSGPDTNNGATMDSTGALVVSQSSSILDFPLFPGSLAIGNTYLARFDRNGGQRRPATREPYCALATELLPTGVGDAAIAAGPNGALALPGNSGILLYTDSAGLAGAQSFSLNGYTVVSAAPYVSPLIRNKARNYDPLTAPYAGSAPGLVAGVMQVNIVAPATGAVAAENLTLNIGGQDTNTVPLSV